MDNSTLKRFNLPIACLLVSLLGTTAARGEDGDAAVGKELVKKYGCLECHTVHGEGGGGEVKAPEWANLYGTTDEMEGGEMVEIDEPYLRESITDPEARIVKDYPSGKMPTRFKHLPEKHLAGIVAYIKQLAPAAAAETGAEAPAAPEPAVMGPAPPVALPASTPAVWIWMFLGFLGGTVVTVGAVRMSREVSWAWVALILAIPAVGLAVGVGWGGRSSGGVEREVKVVARQFAYDPPVIRVDRGDRVSITLTSEDMLHGFYVDGYGIDQEVRPDETVRFSFVANKTGKFGIRCSHTCGVFHPFMIGSLIVSPNRLFPGSMGLCFGLGMGMFLFVSKKREE